MIAIIDYGVGNLFSLKSSLSLIGAESEVTKDAKQIQAADKIILPGVGAFGDAAKKLKDTGMFELVKKEAAAGKPILGICLGMQLLFNRSLEYGIHEGLGLVSGEVRPIAPVIPRGFDVPHMGWNQLHFPEGTGRSPIFKDLSEGDYVYFVHSYAGFDCQTSCTATADYGISLTAAVQQRNVYGTQFHPEKSGETGLRILKAFAEL